MKRIILTTLAVLALIFALGTVGAYELGNIGFWQLLIQFGIAVGVEWLTLSHLEN